MKRRVFNNANASAKSSCKLMRLTIQHQNHALNVAADKCVQVGEPRNQPQHKDTSFEIAVQTKAA
jgi:hypothetical protein